MDHECGHDDGPHHGSGTLNIDEFADLRTCELAHLKRIRSALIGVMLSVTALSGRQGTQTFTGIITDDVCAQEGHGGMQMGPTDAECTRLCVMIHDASYVLADGKTVYALSDQRTPYEFAGRTVNVVGTLDGRTNTIQVDSMTAAE